MVCSSPLVVVSMHGFRSRNSLTTCVWQLLVTSCLIFVQFVKDWKERFTANQIVKGRILRSVRFCIVYKLQPTSALSVDLDSKKVEMTFRSGDFSKPSTSLLA